MTDVSLNFEVAIDAPVHTAFEYCLDPRRIYAGDPTHEVTDATLTPRGLGTTEQIATMTGPIHRGDRDRVRRARPGRADRLRRPSEDDHPMVAAVCDLRLPPYLDVDVRAGGQRDTTDLAVVEHHAPRLERGLDALTVRTCSRAFSKEVRDRLARIEAAAEKYNASAG